MIYCLGVFPGWDEGCDVGGCVMYCLDVFPGRDEGCDVDGRVPDWDDVRGSNRSAHPRFHGPGRVR